MSMASQIDQKQAIQNFPDDLRDSSRRQFMKRMLGATAAVAVMPRLGLTGKERPLSRLIETTAGLPEEKN